MKKPLKNILALCSILAFSFLQSKAQTSASSENSPRYGYRIHSSYFGTSACIPYGGLADYVPTGLGFKYGSSFNLSKSGFADGLMNVGIKTQWINIESNVPYNELGEVNHPEYSIAFSQNYGPQFTLNPVTALYIDFFYLPGWGFRIFPEHGYNTGYYNNYYNTDTTNYSQVHINFSQALGVSLRLYSFYAGFNIQSLSNPLYENGVRLTRFNTFQITLGVCGWRKK